MTRVALARVTWFVLMTIATAAFLSGCNDTYSSVGADRGGARSAINAEGGKLDDLAKASAPYIAESTPGAASYKIGPLDVLEITVFKVPELTQNVQVADDGIINLPLVGDMKASGKTPSALEAELRRKLEGTYIRSPSVRVFVKEFNSARVTIDGAVKNPGVYPLKGSNTLLATISAAGGLDRDIASTDVVIFRMTADGTRAAAQVDLSGIRSGSIVDPVVYPGDVIVVQDSTLKQTYSTLRMLVPFTTLGSLAFMAI